MTFDEILIYLDENEIDYRLVSNFCCGYVFYFLGGMADKCIPRHYYDAELEGEKEKIIAQSVDYLIDRATSFELVKDWNFRIEGENLIDTFNQVELHLIEKYALDPNNH